MADDDDEEEEFGGMFENGHWIWDELTQALAFISDLPPEEIQAVVVTTKAPTGTIEFRDNIDLLEQDVKDVALYTAPLTIMSLVLINLLHTATADRFLRALLFYIQYYLQVAEVMAIRMRELEVKLRTPHCEEMENLYRDNLADLRVLVAKEYANLLVGAADVRKFHHMGTHKKRRSLTDMDARLIETLLRMCVQIVWLALGRKAFNQIELEIHRLFKSETFNMVEHNLKTNYIAKMAPPERATLLGCCNKPEKKLKLRSPMLKEVFCHDVDFRLAALGVVQMTETSPRLLYLEMAVVGAEEKLLSAGLSLGIVGLSRTRFDTMLNEIKMPSKGDDKSRMSMASGVLSSRSLATRSSGGMPTKSAVSIRLYPEIEIPPKEPLKLLPARFVRAELAAQAGARAQVDGQRRRWLLRFKRMVSGRMRGQASSRA